MPEPVPRDARIDLIGYAGQLVDYRDDLRDLVERRMLDAKLERAAGDSYGALLVKTTSSSIEPEGLLRLLERKKITRVQFLSALKVFSTPCKVFMSEQQIAGISTRPKPNTSLRISLLQETKPTLIEAVQRLARDLAS